MVGKYQKMIEYGKDVMVKKGYVDKESIGDYWGITETRPFIIKRKKVKNIYIRILPPDGQIAVTAPLWMKDSTIERFLESKRAWIIRKQEECRKRVYPAAHKYVSGERLALFGRDYILEVREEETKNSVTIEGDRIILKLWGSGSEEKRKRLIENWYRELLKQNIRELILKWEPVMGVSVAEWGVKNMKTRWGSCNIRDRRIWLNLRLAERESDCLEYVVVHEMTHLLEKGHNAVFKSYMTRFLPEWKKLEEKLKSN